jgi:hypothetical protein
MAKPGKKKKVLFVLEIIVLLLFIGGLCMDRFLPGWIRLSSRN